MEGQMETTTDPRLRMFSAEQIQRFEKLSDSIREKVSPLGKLGLPRLLDERRVEFGITDNAFAVTAMFDHVLVYQIHPRHYAKGTYGEGSRLVLPDTKKDAERRAAPRAIIVSAGLKALDELRSNGMDLGDIVMFNHISPWRVETDVIDGHIPHLVIIRTGHIVGSEDTTRRIRQKEISLSTEKDDNGVPFHVYRDLEGKALVPHVATSSEEY